MASVVGKTIFSDGKGKLFFGYYKDNDAVEFVDYKTWKKLSFKDVSKGDTNKERVIKAIVKNQKQFNKKVDFNMWAKQKKRTFEETMDWFIQNGWINNINKGGIKESIDVLSVNEVAYDTALADFNKELEKNSEVKKAAKHYNKSVKDVVRVLQQRIKVNRYSDKSIKQISINYTEDGPLSSKVTIKLSKSYKQNESVNEDRNSNMFYVLYQKKGVFGKPAAAGYKDRKDAEKFAKSLGNNHNTMILDKQSMKNVKGVDVKEGKKRFKRQDGIGKSKYTISYHDGKKKHKDGSDFFDIKIFKNKKDLSDFVGSLVKQGYKLTNESVNERMGDNPTGLDIIHKAAKKGSYPVTVVATMLGKVIKQELVKTPQQVPAVFRMMQGGYPRATIAIEDKKGQILFKESVNEDIEPQTKKIASLTGTRPDAVKDFVSKHALNITKLLKYVQKGGLPQRMELVSALAGRPNNPVQKKIIKMFQESVNEGVSVFDERHFGKKGIIIMIDDNGKKVSAIFKDKKNADKYNRNKPSDIQALLKIAKTKPFGKAIDESVTEAKFGYKDSKASYIKKHKDEYKVAEKMNKGNEMKFYDMLQAMEDKVGHPKTMLFISNALRGYGVDMYKDPKIKNPADAQEALFLLSK